MSAATTTATHTAGGVRLRQDPLPQGAETGDDYGILVDKTRIDRKELARVRGEDRWDERPEVVLVDSTVWNERIIDLGRPLAKIPDGGVIIGRWRAGAKVFVGGAFPIRDARGVVVGALFVRRDVSKL